MAMLICSSEGDWKEAGWGSSFPELGNNQWSGRGAAGGAILSCLKWLIQSLLSNFLIVTLFVDRLK